MISRRFLRLATTACVLFDNSSKASESKKAKQVQELLDLVEVVSKNNKKPFMVDLSHETMENEVVIEDKKKIIKAMKGHYTKQEMSNCKEEAENSLQHQLSQRINKVETKLIETESLLEHKLTEEKNARLEAEKRAKKLQEESSEEIKNLKEKLKKAEKKLDEKGGSCIIL
ncbi:Immune-associated nucleotide-binding protein 11 [Cardamine amara subsp. amara]|uniref:Immune-associated nucleotide-binding protein 11 n=1 Tax=Cardamine amara subsp. amara TaxID=228776 RepID=A0ABD1BRW2_CARAN